MKASKRQIGYLVSLARKVGEHLEFDDFIGEHDEVLITSQVTFSSTIQIS